MILEGGRTEIVNNVLSIPGSDLKLLSLSALAARGAEVHCKDEQCPISFGGQALPVESARESFMC